jgi:peptidoglycan/xylan/chitin deacetylase (PgdA/CDA1 family)
VEAIFFMKNFLHKSPFWLRMIFPNYLWRKPKIKGKPSLYLSFDDGPIPELTPWVLDQLAKHKARATFFCIGDNVRKHPQVFKRLTAEGHSIGNHSFNHLNGWKNDVPTYVDNVLKCEPYFKTTLFRPPYGRIKKAQAEKLSRANYKIIMWDVLAGDWSVNLSAENCLKACLRHSKDGSIIVFHDSLKAQEKLRYVLPKMLDHFTKRGFQFKSL